MEATLFALREDLLGLVNASLTTLEILTLRADQSVLPTVNAHQRKHVKTSTVLILVLRQTVVTTQNAKWSTTFQTVFVFEDMSETLSLHVACLHRVSQMESFKL